MKALCWYGKRDVRVVDVPEPKILNPRDAILRITRTAICGSDLHLYDGIIPHMEPGDVLGHEFMGEVVELGRDVKNLSIGDRVVVPFAIACGQCFFCRRKLWSLCDNSNPNFHLAAARYGQSGSGFFGYSHMFGGYAGGQAEYVRVPFADVGPLKVPDGMSDEQVLFLSDILPTGYMAAENAQIQPGDIVAVWGCGPVGQFAIVAAWWMGAERVIAIDHYPRRLALARDFGKAETISFEDNDVYERLLDITGGRGPDACIDAVGLESHGNAPDALYDRVKQAVGLVADRVHALREAIYCCRKGGTISIPGVYGGHPDRLPLGAVFAKGLTIKTGQTHVQRYMEPLLQRIQNGNGSPFDPTQIISHRFPLEQAEYAYQLFSERQDECIKVVLTP